jgi:hypothetical protein
MEMTKGKEADFAGTRGSFTPHRSGRSAASAELGTAAATAASMPSGMGAP